MFDAQYIPTELYFKSLQVPAIVAKCKPYEIWEILQSFNGKKATWSKCVGGPKMIIPLVSILTNRNEISEVIEIACRLMAEVTTGHHGVKLLIGTPLMEVDAGEGPRIQCNIGMAVKIKK